MSEGPWIRFFPSDWLAGTRGMTAAETGIYITLVAMMYERGEPIPNDTSRLARLCGTTTAALKSTLSILCDEGKISVVDGALWNDRVGVETEIRRDKSTSAQKSAETRWQKQKQNQHRNDASELHTQSDRNANQKPDTREDASASLSKEIEREFHDAFWPAYPLKVGKPQALKAYISARKRATFDEITYGLRRYAAERDGQDKKFTKQPQGWLNRDGWTDEPIPHSPPAPRQSTDPPRKPPRNAGELSYQQLMGQTDEYSNNNNRRLGSGDGDAETPDIGGFQKFAISGELLRRM